MPFKTGQTSLLYVASQWLTVLINTIQLHSADPGDGGSANRNSAAPLQCVWTNPDNSGGFQLATPLTFTDCGPGTLIAWISLWHVNHTGTDPNHPLGNPISLSFGDWYGNFPINAGDTSADKNGNYTLSTLTVVASTT